MDFMKMNLDCVRDVLLALENQEFNEVLSFESLKSNLRKYTESDLQYACIKLHEAGYIKASYIEIDNAPMPYVPEIYDITFQGHEFLNNVREKSVWDKTKSIAKSIGTFSVQAIGQIAFNVVEEIIKSHFGSP